MNDKKVAISDALKFGWTTLQANAVFFLKLLALLIAISIIPAMLLGKVITMAGMWLGVPLQFLMLAWQMILAMGLIKICLKFIDGQTPELSDLWSAANQVLNYAAVKFLFTLIVAVGLILLIVPGLIWMMQFYLAGYLVIDKGFTPIKALKASSTITHGAKWDLGLFTTVIALVNVAGIIVLGVGLLITLPITLLASVYIYRQLLQQTETSGQPLITV